MTRTGRIGAERRGAHRLSAADVRLHSLLVVGVPICVAAGWFELNRALAGRAVAWVYTFEWPLFGIYGVYIWWRLYRERKSTTTPANVLGDESSAAADIDDLDVPGPRARAEPARTHDPQLAEWEQYLRRLHSVDPPGRPPERIY
ncbi:MAG: hypothetical protein M3Y44_02745 [Actinomycetota bacterium]|nr:hypothetical protein [Actinomycetota bacterium]